MVSGVAGLSLECVVQQQGGHMAVAAWRSGNVVGRINEVTLRRARLVLGSYWCSMRTFLSCSIELILLQLHSVILSK